MPYGLDLIAVYGTWVGGTTSHVYKDPAQDGCGQKPNGRAVVPPVCLTCVSITLLIHGGISKRLHMEWETGAAYRD